MLIAKHGDVASTKGQFPSATPFGYLLAELMDKPDAHLPGDPAKVVADLDTLGAAMVDNDAPTASNSTRPPIYTYWGQFIDHDMTANTDRASATSDITKAGLSPVPPEQVVQNLQNLRRPNLDLDSVYGDGPVFINPRSADAALYDGPRLRVGTNSADGIPGVRIPPEDDLHRDLPRIGPLLDEGVITMNDVPEGLRDDPNLRTRPLIGDLRNDENLVVAQFHTAVLRFHNEVINRVMAEPGRFGVHGQPRDRDVFRIAQQLTRFHYQWLVVNDFLKTVLMPSVVDDVLTNGPKFYKPLPGHQLYMPLEHSVAAYRFGHSMVRGGYDWNRNFGKPAPRQTQNPLRPFASFQLLFQFTGNGFSQDPNDPSKSIRNPFGGAPTLPFNWIAEFDRLTRKGDRDPAHFARKIDTRLVPPILNMVDEGTNAAIQGDADRPVRELLRHLARRNLLRGYSLSLPTGQAAASAMGIAPLSADELRQGNADAVNGALEQGGFLVNTPLWYYVLKEAEVRANGDTLGPLGSRIVAETIVGIVMNDRDSFFNVNGGWNPSMGVTLPGGGQLQTIRDFLSFTGVPV